jgi:hypothetical protein
MIMQKIRQAERDNAYIEYKDRIGEVVSGTVRQIVRRDLIIDIGRVTALLPARERIPKEEFEIGRHPARVCLPGAAERQRLERDPLARLPRVCKGALPHRGLRDCRRHRRGHGRRPRSGQPRQDRRALA